MKTKTKAVWGTVGAAALLAMGTNALVVQAAPHSKMHSKIGAARANAIVLKRFPGKLTTKTTLENEEGTWQYGVMVRSGHTLREVMVDANSGKIANVETTTASKERVEKKADVAALKAHHAATGGNRNTRRMHEEQGEHEQGETRAEHEGHSERKDR